MNSRGAAPAGVPAPVPPDGLSTVGRPTSGWEPTDSGGATPRSGWRSGSLAWWVRREYGRLAIDEDVAVPTLRGGEPERAAAEKA